MPKVIFMDGRQNIPDKITFDKTAENEFHSMADILSASPGLRFSNLLALYAPPKECFTLGVKSILFA